MTTPENGTPTITLHQLSRSFAWLDPWGKKHYDVYQVVQSTTARQAGRFPVNNGYATYDARVFVAESRTFVEHPPIDFGASTRYVEFRPDGTRCGGWVDRLPGRCVDPNGRPL